MSIRLVPSSSNMSLTPQDTQNRGIKRSPLSRWDVAVRLMHHDPSDLES